MSNQSTLSANLEHHVTSFMSDAHHNTVDEHFYEEKLFSQINATNLDDVLHCLADHHQVFVSPEIRLYLMQLMCQEYNANQSELAVRYANEKNVLLKDLLTCKLVCQPP